jgi:hypothetical protein
MKLIQLWAHSVGAYFMRLMAVFPHEAERQTSEEKVQRCRRLLAGAVILRFLILWKSAVLLIAVKGEAGCVVPGNENA